MPVLHISRGPGSTPQDLRDESLRRRVDVWCCPLDVPPDETPRLRRILSPDELDRADRFRFDIDRRRYVAGRAHLRNILARYAGANPARLRFDYGPCGKPALCGDCNASRLSFNLSRTGAIALVAVTKSQAVGIDVEIVRPISDADDIVRYYFSPAERDAYNAIPPAFRPSAFLRLWTIKEAIAKLDGLGLAGRAGRRGVSVAPFRLLPRYFAAVALHGQVREIRVEPIPPPLQLG